MIQIPAAILPLIEVAKKIWDGYKANRKTKKAEIIEDRIKGQEEQVDEFNAFKRWMIRFGKKR